MLVAAPGRGRGWQSWAVWFRRSAPGRWCGGATPGRRVNGCGGAAPGRGRGGAVLVDGAEGMPPVEGCGCAEINCFFVLVMGSDCEKFVCFLVFFMNQG